MAAALLLALLVLGAALAPLYGRPAAAFLAATSVAWIFGNQSMEGEILVVFSPTHGLTSADFGALAGLLVAVVVWIWFPRGSKQRKRR
jgi:hypothetical protein